MSGKPVLLTKIPKLTRKFFKSLEYWEFPFSFEVVAPQLRFIILTLGFILVYLTLSIILDIELEENILLSMILIIVSLIITRAFSHLLFLFTSILIIIFILKLSFMNYSVTDVMIEYEKFVKATNPIDYFKSSKPYSNKIDNLIIKKIDKSDRMREFSLVASTKYFDYMFEEFGKPARFMSAYVFINKHWRYVEENGDHIFDQRFQMNLFEKEGYLAGDCDDFTVLLVSVFQCLGSEDIIITSIPDHVFLELKIIDECELNSYVKMTTRLFNAKEEEIYFEKDEKGYWLNFSVGGYPGYKFDRDLVVTRMEINL